MKFLPKILVQSEKLFQELCNCTHVVKNKGIYRCTLSPRWYNCLLQEDDISRPGSHYKNEKNETRCNIETSNEDFLVNCRRGQLFKFTF